MPGAGTQKAGTTSAGYGVSASATAPAGHILRDEKTGKRLGARRINPLTRQYVLDENGRILGLGHVRAAVQLAVQIEQGSCAVGSVGQRLSSLERITPNFERQVLAILSEALQPLVALGYVEVKGFREFRTGNNTNGLAHGAVYGRFLWKDLTTGQEHTELI